MVTSTYTSPMIKTLSILSLSLVLGVLAAADDHLDLRDLVISPGRWTPRQPALVAITPVADRPGATCFEMKPSDQDWVVVDGPEIAITERSNCSTASMAPRIRNCSDAC